jgi:hypothetical protein
VGTTTLSSGSDRRRRPNTMAANLTTRAGSLAPRE